MKDTIRQLIQQALDQLTADGTLPAGLTPDIQVENTKDRSHGDFASNIAMMLAKPAGMKPRDLAARLVEAIPAHEQLAKVEIAGPGFLNFFQDHVWLAASLDRALADERLGVRKAGPAQRVVIDLSSPNLAKEMHVGHLRSTIIGDAVARVLEFLGDTVIRQNHVGDWAPSSACCSPTWKSNRSTPRPSCTTWRSSTARRRNASTSLPNSPTAPANW